MNRCIELHDSELASVTPRAGAIELLLDPAYIHQSEREPGVHSGTGWVQQVVVRIHGYSLQTAVPPLPDKISDGTLQVGTRLIDNGVPLPFRTEHDIDLQLTLASSGLSLRISGSGMETEELGEPRFVERFEPQPYRSI